jgi:aarF domain-containing kinase
MKGMRLGILDWGQTKTLEPQLKRQLARLLVEMGKEDNDERIKREFYRLGVVTEKESDAKSVSKMVYSMFSTEQIEEFCDNPFSKDHGLNHNAVLSFPSELCYILRTIQIIRGLSVGLGVDFSLMKTWSPMAQGYLDREKEAQIAKEQEVIDFNRKVTI